MRDTLLVQTKRRFQLRLGFLKKDMVFTISFVLAVASCFFHTPKLEYIDFKVLVSLFNLMLAIKAFEELRVLDKFAVGILNRSKNSKTVSVILVSLCFFSSMIVTNDVALLTFVPLTLVISQKTKFNMMETVILQTIAANLGSSITPMGNPQNLYIYSFYGLKALPFFSVVILLGVLGFGLLFFSMYKVKKQDLSVDLSPIKISNPKQAALWGAVLAMIILSIFGLVSYIFAFVVTVIAVIGFNANLFKKIDYQLLLTFICFFIFIGNVSSIGTVRTFASTSLNDAASVYFSSIFLSQFISNVPASILLSKFTAEWKPLLLGVNIGGLGTIIASLASVISFKLFSLANPQDTKKYLVKFTIYNFSFLVILTLVVYIFL